MPLVIIPEHAHAFRIVHAYLERAVLRFDFESDEAIVRFNNLLRRYKVEEALEAYGAEEGDTILLGDVAFDFLPQRSAKANSSAPDSSGEEHLRLQIEKAEECQ
jgi:GTP-binding protein